MSRWTVRAVAHGPLYDTLVYVDGEYVGSILLTQQQYADLRRRLLDDDPEPPSTTSTTG